MPRSRKPKEARPAAAAPAPAPTTLQRVAATAFVAQMMLTGLLGSCLVLVPLGALLRWGPGGASVRLARRGVDAVIGSWLSWNAAWSELVLGVRVARSGDAAGGPSAARAAESALLMCNHRTRLDWMWLYPWGAAWGRLRNYKAVLKAGLAALPGVGWGMQVAGFVFLRRRWEEDRAAMTASLGYYGRSRYPMWLVFFPEGTDRSAHNLERSREFARARGLPEYREVLHPRTTGLVHTVRALGEGLDAVYDVTVAYGGTVVETERQLLSGAGPRSVHLHARRFDAAELRALSDDELAAWVERRFAEKERWLADFYASPPAEPPRRPAAELLAAYAPNAALWVASLALVWANLAATLPLLALTSAVAIYYTRRGESWSAVEARRAAEFGVTYS